MAGVFKVEISAEVKGPLADGSGAHALDQWSQNVAKRLGDEGVKLLGDFPMDKGGHGHSHGGFKANLKVMQDGPVVRIPGPMITGVTWSPWLEGTSKRNESTRFGGYHLFRKTAQQLRKRSTEIGQQELEKILPRLGGD